MGLSRDTGWPADQLDVDLAVLHDIDRYWRSPERAGSLLGVGRPVGDDLHMSSVSRESRRPRARKETVRPCARSVPPINGHRKRDAAGTNEIFRAVDAFYERRREGPPRFTKNDQGSP